RRELVREAVEAFAVGGKDKLVAVAFNVVQIGGKDELVGRVLVRDYAVACRAVCLPVKRRVAVQVCESRAVFVQRVYRPVTAADKVVRRVLAALGEDVLVEEYAP